MPCTLVVLKVHLKNIISVAHNRLGKVCVVYQAGYPSYWQGEVYRLIDLASLVSY